MSGLDNRHLKIDLLLQTLQCPASTLTGLFVPLSANRLFLTVTNRDSREKQITLSLTAEVSEASITDGPNRSGIKHSM